MIRIEVTETELSTLRDLLEEQRNADRRLVIQDGSLSHLLTRTDRLMGALNAAAIRHEPRRRRA